MRVAETGLTMAEYFRDVDASERAVCSSIIFSVLYRQVLRCLRCLDVCRISRRISADSGNGDG